MLDLRKLLLVFAAALMAMPSPALAQCYRDAYGNLVCSRRTVTGGTATTVRTPAATRYVTRAPVANYAYRTRGYQTRAYTTSRRGLFGRTVYRTRYQAVPVATEYRSGGSYSSSGSSYGGYSAGSSGTYAKPAAVETASPEPPAKAGASLVVPQCVAEYRPKYRVPECVAKYTPLRKVYASR